MFRLCAQRSIASPESTWLSRIGAELAMMSLTSEMLVLKSPARACVESTSRCSAGPSPPTACASRRVARRSCLSAAPPTRGRRDPTPARSRLGTVLLVMVCPSRRSIGRIAVDTRSRYCSPTADTECTLADASTGILYGPPCSSWPTTPLFVGSTSVTLPMVVPRIGHVGRRVQTARRAAGPPSACTGRHPSGRHAQVVHSPARPPR